MGREFAPVSDRQFQKRALRMLVQQRILGFLSASRVVLIWLEEGGD